MRVLVLLIGCRADEAPLATDGVAPTDSGSSTEIPDLDSAEPASGADLAGVVATQDGVPIPDLELQLCALVCRLATTDAGGRFSYEDVEATGHRLHVEGPEPLAPALFTVTLGEGDSRELSVTLPTLGPPLAIPGAGEVAAGLLLTVKDQEPEVTEVAGAAVPRSDLPLFEVPGEVLAAWYLSPHLAVKGSVYASFSGEGLDGATVSVAELTGTTWSDVGVVSGSAEVRLPAISTVVLWR